MKRYPFKRLSNDLFVETDLTCECSAFPDHPNKMMRDIKEKITTTGYYDNYFFDIIFDQPRAYRCKCGCVITVQWFRDGVEISIDKEGKNE